ncbi:MAG: phosphate signaling complex protein PhoU [Pseudomonadota bacterium]
MTQEHIVKSFDEELKLLNHTIAQMGGLAEVQLQTAVDALMRRDAELAGKVIQGDKRIDDLEHQVGDMTIRMLALRQPMASDLREVVAALKISADLERIGDYASNIAKRAVAISQAPPVTTNTNQAIPRMSQLVQSIIKDVLDAYVDHNAERAMAAWSRDEEVDALYNSLFRELLTYMMEDPRNIGPCTHLMFIAKNIERIGDHATNIAETIYFLVHGRGIESARPKGDVTSYAVTPPPG